MASAVSTASRFMPPQATDIAIGVDRLYGFLLVASFISCVLVIGGMIYFVVKYRRESTAQKSAYISHNVLAEFLWSFIPFVIFMVVFVWGWIVFHQLRSMPDNALEIAVEAQKWDWSFVYKNGRRSSSEFYVPVGQNVKLVMTSKDVLHSFYVPAFRNKQDVVPGRYINYWFNANTIGKFNIFCAEYCGDKHSAMLAKVNVVSLEEYENWLGNDPYKGLAPAEIGQKLYTTRCVACHTLTDQKNVGPGFKGVFGRTEHFEDGGSVVVDEKLHP
jgi:cytochrome c oxidase subunit 2